ncbi:rod shape-determining protein RodA [Candidatus Dojkabacteria bacterium]|nr:rod shape-determining protein RodA [Candidatus Dojkabacteria bacterium]
MTHNEEGVGTSLIGNVLIFVNAFLINLIGLLVIYSTTISPTSDGSGTILTRQILLLLISLLIYFVISKIDYTYIAQPQVIILTGLFSIGLLYGVLLWGIELKGAQRWFDLGVFTLQPSEFAKIFLIIVFAGIFTLIKSKKSSTKWLKLLIAGIYLLINAYLIFSEPDAGMTFLLLAIGGFVIVSGFDKPFLILASIPLVVFSFLIAIGISYKIPLLVTVFAVILFAYFIVGLILYISKRLKPSREILIVALVFLVIGTSIGFAIKPFWESNILKPYHKQRIETFLNPEADPEGAGFNVSQSKIAVGSGQILGKGLGHGTQSKLQFLPEYQTDFIFAAYAEEFGFVGSTLLLVLYLLLIIQVLYLSSQIKDRFGAIICFGLGIKFALEILINVGMNLGITPATGVPLPFVSAGGSNLLANYIALGLIQSIYKTDAEIITA